MEKIDQSVFKAYDIRGVYPTQIDADLVYKIAQAYVQLLQGDKPSFAKATEGRHGLNTDGLTRRLRVAVGHDMRLCGEEFQEAATKSLVDAGVDVVDLGLISTDQMYFGVVHLGVDGGLMATASHNPKEFGGLKMVREKSMPISGDSGIYQIRDLVVSDKWKVESDKVGKVEQQDIRLASFDHVFKTFDVSKIKPFKIVANTNFGMATQALGELKKRLPIEFIEVVNGNLDGNFPKGPSDPLLPSNRTETIEAIKNLHPDLGVAWDGDADRCFFFDELGNFVTPAYASALLAQYYLERNPGAKILHDTRVVRVIDDVVKQNGGAAIMTKAGHSFIKERMIKEGAIFGCETSAHYYFKDNYYLDNGLFPFLAILEIISAADKPFSEVLRPLRDKFFISEEINFEFKNPNVLEMVKTKYADAKIDNVDGYDFNYPDWRFNLRSSNTQNLLRVNIEANSSELLQQKIAEVCGYINEIK